MVAGLRSEDKKMENIRQAAKEKGCKGYRVIVDGKHYAFSRYCKALEREMSGIIGEPRIYRNVMGELAINYDND
jgi:hypothetical protein